jgi:hypothetical protein
MSKKMNKILEGLSMVRESKNTYKGPLSADVERVVKEIAIEGVPYYVRENDYDGLSLIDGEGHFVCGTNKDGKNIRFPENFKTAKELVNHVYAFLDNGGSLRIDK